MNQNSKDLKSFKGFYKNDLPNGLGEAEYVDGSIYKVSYRSNWHMIRDFFRGIGQEDVDMVME